MKFANWEIPTISLTNSLSLWDLFNLIQRLTPREQVDLVSEMYNFFSDEQRKELERLIDERTRD
jgi:precorrin-3B methylase